MIPQVALRTLARLLSPRDLQVMLHARSQEEVADLAIARDLAVWRPLVHIDKYWGQVTQHEINNKLVTPYDVYDKFGNLLTYGGMSCMWQTLIGNGTASAGQSLTYFSNAQAALGSGDSNTAAAATQTDLQAATNKIKKAMDATYPLHTDATTSGAAVITFRSTFATGDANWAWQEWVIGNSTTAATGRILNRAVASLGTKTSAASWVFTVTVTLS